MVALETPICDFGWKAPEFNLIGIDNKYYSFQDIKGPNGTLVMFICNHCPYVKSVIHRIVDDTTDINKANDMLQGYNLIEQDKNTTYSIVKFEQPLVLKEAV